MSEKAKILVVDDVETVRRLLKMGLSRSFEVVDAASGEEALAMLGEVRPSAILLDVEMQPGIDGFETCRRIRLHDEFARVPVVFVSAREAIEDRLAGYEAGGEDYVVKPFSAPELVAKLQRLIDSTAERGRLNGLARDASCAAMAAMQSMGEMGALLEVVKQLGTASSVLELADAMVAGVALYGLEACVQLRVATGVLTRCRGGEASPLEVSVMDHLVGMGRLEQFKTRMVINYPVVSLLVRDMPLKDEDRCGRLRDHLTMLVETADVHARALAALALARQRDEEIVRLAVCMTGVLGEVDRAQRDNLVSSRIALENVRQRVDVAYVSMMLTTSQENMLNRALDEGVEELLNSQADISDLQNRLSQMLTDLRRVVGGDAS
ncbi:PleD family two-component system response regulator [Aquitalea sp. ASV15]|uniref:response regulator n=1 Tax=Aquitalea sp. ASV15 TaxID=2795104 RepID=UPI0018ECEC07|nr:response regulator [Aquitalea sp. ASV15]